MVREITLTYGDHFDSVLVDGKPLSPDRSLEVWPHSPDGFSWGYGGSGPAQLALALLLNEGLDEDTAVRLHQDLKWEHVAGWPHDGRGDVQVIKLDLAAWIAEHRVEA